MNSPARLAPALLALLAALGVAAWPEPAQAAFRCGSKLVSEGDTSGTVRAICGPPTEARRERIRRPPIIWRNGLPLRIPSGDVEIPVEIWIYNLGPDQLMRRIRFEDGVVTAMDTLGYGYP